MFHHFTFEDYLKARNCKIVVDTDAPIQEARSGQMPLFAEAEK